MLGRDGVPVGVAFAAVGGPRRPFADAGAGDASRVLATVAQGSGFSAPRPTNDW